MANTFYYVKSKDHMGHTVYYVYNKNGKYIETTTDNAQDLLGRNTYDSIDAMVAAHPAFVHTAGTAAPKWDLNLTGTGANWNLTAAEKQKLIDALMRKGEALTDAELVELNVINKDANKPGTDRFTNLQQAMTRLIENNSQTIGIPSQSMPQGRTGIANSFRTEPVSYIETIRRTPSGETTVYQGMNVEGESTGIVDTIPEGANVYKNYQEYAARFTPVPEPAPDPAATTTPGWVRNTTNDWYHWEGEGPADLDTYPDTTRKTALQQMNLTMSASGVKTILDQINTTGRTSLAAGYIGEDGLPRIDAEGNLIGSVDNPDVTNEEREDARTRTTYEPNLEFGGTGAGWNLNKDDVMKILDAIREKSTTNGTYTGLTETDLRSLGIFQSGADATKIKTVLNAIPYLVDANAGYVGWRTDATAVDFDNNVVVPSTDTLPTDEGSGGSESGTPMSTAFNAYYNDLYSLRPGTGGSEMLGRLEDTYENQAKGAINLADAGYQAQAMQQAQTVKAITDQVRSERMSRLRAGMSESQIANQDMQMMMANIGALNENAQVANQARLEAQVGYNGAKDAAYMDYLDQANARGQNAAAFYAADSGNAYWNTIQRMRTLHGPDASKWTAEQYKEASNYVVNPTANN